MTSDPKPISDDLLSRWERVAWRDSANNKTTIILPSTLLEMIARIEAADAKLEKIKATRATALNCVRLAWERVKAVENALGLHDFLPDAQQSQITAALSLLGDAREELSHGL